jgi:hypothetical protein
MSYKTYIFKSDSLEVQYATVIKDGTLTFDKICTINNIICPNKEWWTNFSEIFREINNSKSYWEFKAREKINVPVIATLKKSKKKT